MITSVLTLLKDLLSPEVPEFEIELNGLMSLKTDEHESASCIKITLFKFSEDRSRRNLPPSRPFGNTFQKKVI